MNALTGTALQSVADRLFHAWDDGRLIASLREELRGREVGFGYAVQTLNASRWEAAGRRIVGRKIAFTSTAARQSFGIAEPAAGVLFDDMLLPSGSSLAISQLHHARAEAEIALVLGATLSQRTPTYIDVLCAVDFALPAIEIVDSRVEAWDIAACDFVADNAAACRVVIGDSPFDIRRHDLSELSMTMSIDGTRCANGSGSECMSNPLRALHWLAVEMARQGTPLRQGDLVMTGALGPVLRIEGPCTIETTIGPFAPVNVSITQKPDDESPSSLPR
jgi:2-keto-4-pentenoate hydratase